MPLYEYECQDCQEQFEKLVRMSIRDEEVECPACGTRHARRVISLTASVGRSGTVGAACAPSGGG